MAIRIQSKWKNLQSSASVVARWRLGLQPKRRPRVDDKSWPTSNSYRWIYPQTALVFLQTLRCFAPPRNTCKNHLNLYFFSERNTLKSGKSQEHRLLVSKRHHGVASSFSFFGSGKIHPGKYPQSVSSKHAISKHMMKNIGDKNVLIVRSKLTPWYSRVLGD